MNERKHTFGPSGFSFKKQYNLSETERLSDEIGDIWTFTAVLPVAMVTEMTDHKWSIQELVTANRNFDSI